MPYALWTCDQPPTLPNVGVYGAHPFYMDVREGAPAATCTLWQEEVDLVCCRWLPPAASHKAVKMTSSIPHLSVPMRADGQTHGVLLLNSNGMDVAITETKLQYRVIGGVLDFYFFMGPTPLKVIDQLTSIVGRPYMPPYWALGLMQSK